MDRIQLAVVIIVAVIIIRYIVVQTSKDKRAWQSCAQKYRLKFNETTEQRGEGEEKVYRLSGYYRTCLISISSNRKETRISVNYTKGLMDGLKVYPDGTLSRIGRGLVKQATSGKSPRQSFFLTMPPSKGSQTEVQKELNPAVREQLSQLFIICTGVGRRIDMTDAYMLIKQTGYVKNPEEVFPIVDEVLTAINVLEGYSTELLK
jgi:hypothetical protein